MFETIFPVVLTGATLLVALTAGFLFAFAVIAMPGLKNLNDGEFIRAFQEMDGIIQNNHPLFMLVWMGSVLSLIAAAIIGFMYLEGLPRNLLIAAAVLYIMGVQAPTIALNIPRNNKIQAVNVEASNATALQQARVDFEDGWNRSNQFRTVMSITVTAILLSLILWL
ncbi:MAG: anthrone oxygenase family protein [Chloroflexota bacterium]